MVNPYLPTYDEIKSLVGPRWTVCNGAWEPLDPANRHPYWDHFPWLGDAVPGNCDYELALKRDDGQRVIVRPNWASRGEACCVLKAVEVYEVGNVR
jgi:hypothetical protein